MTTNLIELPQARGAIVAIFEALQCPNQSSIKKELRNMGIVGIAAAANFVEETHNGNFPSQGRVGSRRNRKIEPAKRIDEIAKKMLEAGRSPQEVGEVTAALLGWKG